MKRLDIIQAIGGFALVVLALSFFGLVWFEMDIFKKIIKSCFIVIVAVLIAERWNKV